MDKCTKGALMKECGNPSAMFVRNSHKEQDFHFCRACAAKSLRSEWQITSPWLTMHIANRLVLSDTTLILQSYFDYWEALTNG